MSKAIQVLESMAQQADVDVEKLLTNSEINAEQSKAIINKDITSLERQLDICPDIVCTFAPAEDDEPEEESEEEKTNDETKSIVNI